MAAILVITRGNLGGDPRVIPSKYGVIVSFSVAFSRIGGANDPTTWIKCSAFGKTAEYVEKWCKKGDRVSLAGEFYQSSYQKDGDEIFTLECKISQIEKIGYQEARQDQSDDDGPYLGGKPNGSPF